MANQARDEPARFCFACTKCGTGKTIKMCGRCHVAQYCSVECQRADWTRIHKQICTPACAILPILSFEVEEYTYRHDNHQRKYMRLEHAKKHGKTPHCQECGMLDTLWATPLGVMCDKCTLAFRSKAEKMRLEAKGKTRAVCHVCQTHLICDCNDTKWPCATRTDTFPQYVMFMDTDSSVDQVHVCSAGCHKQLEPYRPFRTKNFVSSVLH